MPTSCSQENSQTQMAGNGGIKNSCRAEGGRAITMAKPIGEVAKITGEGEGRRSHYRSFDFDGIQYELEDFVYICPRVDDENNPVRRPDVAIIKDISQGLDGCLWITRRRLCRPERAKKHGGGRWKACDNREVYHSFRKDYVPASTIMHKCRVHYIPSNQKPPSRSENPGLFVQKVYDHHEKILYNIEDNDFMDDLQEEIDLLIQKSHKHLLNLNIENVHERLGELGIEKPLEGIGELDIRNQPSELEQGYDDLAVQDVITKLKASTGNKHRDWGLEKLLEGVEPICKFKRSSPLDDKSLSLAVSGDMDDVTFSWPRDAILAVTGLEMVAYESLGMEFNKYKQKIRSLAFNLKNNTRLALRLLKKELEPSVILNMNPVELKDGLTAKEREVLEPEKSKPMEMTDARCKNCNEKAGIVDFIKAGGSRDRYLLECISCGNQWYDSPDAIFSPTIDASAVGNVGTAPWATAKFEDVQKHSEKPSPNIFLKQTVPYMPTLETQKSFRGKAKAKEANAAAD